MSDLRELLLPIIVQARDWHGDMAIVKVLDLLLPVIEAELAQATADALEAVKQLIHDAAALAMVNEKHSADVGNKMIEYSRNVVQQYLYDLRQQVVALIPADIAAKAKEREGRIEQLECQLAGCDVAAIGWADKNPNSPPPKQGDWGWSPAFQSVLELRQKWEAQREHDAKIRREERELFFRTLDGYSKLALSNERHGESVGNEGLRYSRSVVRQYLHDIEKELRAEWANEADGGEK